MCLGSMVKPLNWYNTSESVCVLYEKKTSYVSLPRDYTKYLLPGEFSHLPIATTDDASLPGM